MISLSIARAEIYDLVVVGIDDIGPELLSKVKKSENINWWLEFGDELVIATTTEAELKLPVSVEIERIIKNVQSENLAFQTMGHCDHSEIDDILHSKLDVVYSSEMVRIIDTRTISNKINLFKHKSILPFEKNKVLVYQFTNRRNKTGKLQNSQTQTLVDMVDKGRWYDQVEYLASLDRMLENDLNTSGDWLEQKFNQLGLVTSKLSLHAFYRGSNILGFKQGTLYPDHWYVVGAHMDSRNGNWDDNQPSPGAEDNASGCSGVLEIANVITQYDTESSIFFMCFIEEESGLLGSKDVVNHFTNEGNLNKIKAMINLDMIGYRAPEGNTAIAGSNSIQNFSMVDSLAAFGTLYTDLNWQVSLSLCCTDFVSFANAGVPAISSNQPNISSYFGYHSTQDLAVNVDPDLGSGIVKANLAMLIDLVGVDFNSGDLIFKNTFE